MCYISHITLGKQYNHLFTYFLADRTATQYWHHPVIRLPSVCLSVTLCIVALRVGVQG